MLIFSVLARQAVSSTPMALHTKSSVCHKIYGSTKPLYQEWKEFENNLVWKGRKLSEIIFKESQRRQKYIIQICDDKANLSSNTSFFPGVYLSGRPPPAPHVCDCGSTLSCHPSILHHHLPCMEKVNIVIIFMFYLL